MRRRTSLRALGWAPLAWTVAAIAVLSWAAVPARAVTLTWDPDNGTFGAQDGSGTWDTSNTNWWDGAANVTWSNATPDTAVFGAGGAGSETVTLGGTVLTNHLTFNAGPVYTLTGGTLQLANPGGNNNVTANQDAVIASPITGGRMYKYGGGTLVLSGNNTFGGGGAMDVRDGTLNLRHDNALGNSDYAHVFSEKTLEVQDNITVSNGLYIGNSSAASTTVSLRNVSGDNAWNGYVRLHGSHPYANVRVEGGSTLTFNGQVQPHGAGTGALRKLGGGTLIFARDNTYQGDTFVDEGILSIRDGAALGATGPGTTVASGAVLQMQGNIAVGAEPLGLAGGGIGGTGALRSLSGTNSWAGPLTLSGTTTIGVDADTLTLSGPIGGSNLYKQGAGTLVLSGNNTFGGGGAMDVRGGVVNLRHNSALGTSGYAHVYSGQTLELQDNITIGNGLYIGNSSSSDTAVSLRNVSGDNAWNGYVRLHVSHPHARISVEPGSTLTINGVIEPHGGSVGSLTKLGGGTLIFTNANTYTGRTNVEAGTLRLAGGPNRINPATDIWVSNATFDLNGQDQEFQTWSRFAAGTTLMLGGGGTLTLHAADIWAATTVTGTGSLVKTGTGTVTFGSSNADYSGGTTINGGRLALYAGSNRLPTAGDVQVDGAGIFDLNY